MATIVEGNPKAPFSIATTPRCRGGRYSFPGWLYFTLDLHLIMLSVKQGGIKYHFLSLWYDSTWDWTQVSRAIGEPQWCRAHWIFKQWCHVTTSSWIKIFIHAGLRTGLYGRDLIHKSLYNLLHFSSHQRNKFLYFCSTIVNIVFSFINITTLHIYVIMPIKTQIASQNIWTLAEDFAFYVNDCYSMSSSSRAASMDIPDPLSPLLPIIHRFWQVFRVTSCILT